MQGHRRELAESILRSFGHHAEHSLELIEAVDSGALTLEDIAVVLSATIYERDRLREALGGSRRRKDSINNAPALWRKAAAFVDQRISEAHARIEEQQQSISTLREDVERFQQAVRSLSNEKKRLEEQLSRCYSTLSFHRRAANLGLSLYDLPLGDVEEFRKRQVSG